MGVGEGVVRWTLKGYTGGNRKGKETNPNTRQRFHPETSSKHQELETLFCYQAHGPVLSHEDYQVH